MKNVEVEQVSMVNWDVSCACHMLKVGDSVLVRNYTSEKWVNSKVGKVLGERHYLVEVK